LIRVAIADDHVIVRAGLRALLAGEPDMVLAGEAGDGEQAIALASQQRIDVFLMDLGMPGMDGVEAIARLRVASPTTRVLVLSMHGTPEYVRPALRAGAAGYVVKGAGLDDLLWSRFARCTQAAATSTKQPWPPCRISRPAMDVPTMSNP
jgi:DNA-binding NarL/FixJ family response regulator